VRLDLDETFDEKPELLPVIFLGLSEDTVGYLVKAGAPVRTLSELQAYNLARQVGVFPGPEYDRPGGSGPFRD
jgi:hypothetical protein